MTHAVLFFDICGHSPAWPLIPKALLELDAAGLGYQPFISPAWNDSCMASMDEAGSVKGFLIYRYDEQRCSWFITLSYVVPAYRRQGIHTALFKALVERAEMRGDILSIESGTHVNNIAAQFAFEAQGRRKVAVSYEYRVRDWIAGKPHLDMPKDMEPAERSVQS